MAERELKFEESLEKLDGIMEDLESEGTPLEEAIQLYEEGMKLVKVCEKKLAVAQARIEKILPQSSDDRPSAGPLNLPDA